MTGMLDQNSAHRLCGRGKEMLASLPIRGGILYQSQIRLMNKGGGLQRVAHSLGRHLGSRKAS
jgi:hypothetical protein